VPRIDTREKSTGCAVYTIDIDLPGMRHATIVRPPRSGGRPRYMNAADVRAVDGVVDVVETPSGLAIVARSYWSVLTGRKALRAEWRDDEAERRGSEAIDGACEIWTGCQSQTRDPATAAGILGIEPASVTINTQLAGGSFGRRAVPTSDFVAEAVHVARARGTHAPVKVQWTREDDMSGGYYRPIALHRLRAVLRGAITLTDGVVDQQHFDACRPLRINEMPRIDVHIVPLAEPPTGVGKPGLSERRRRGRRVLRLRLLPFQPSPRQMLRLPPGNAAHRAASPQPCR
jgi:CO/xanthine dehydrogenase Mo-binding subunit